MSDLTAALTDRLRDEFVPGGRYSEATLIAVAGSKPNPPAAILVSEFEVIVQALDFVTGELVWQATFTVDAPLELILVTARSAADGDR
jgi:hypothetical protein